MENIKNDSMNTVLNNGKKREYQAPEIIVVGLDNEISLQLESSPPYPGNENISMSPEYFNQSPFGSENC